MDVQLGTQTTKFPSEFLQRLDSANHLLGKPAELKKQLASQGYLYLKEFHPRQDVLNARTAVLKYLDQQGSHILNTEKFDIQDGVLNHKCGIGCIPFMEGRNAITHSDELKRVIEGNHVFNFFEKLFDESALTFDFKWLRAMYKGGFTGAHVDRVYMSRGSQELLTMWTPLGDISVDMGVLAVCEGSHKEIGFKRLQETYAECDLEAQNITGTGWLTENPLEVTKLGGQWKTENFEAGDVIIFNIRLVHMSTTNLTKFARISCDTRWQPISHAVDERFVGDLKTQAPKYGVYGSRPFSQKTVESLKPSWGLQ